MKTALIVLFLSSCALCATIEDALVSIRPKAAWSLRGNSYSCLEWLDAVQSKPTEQEILDEVVRLNQVEEQRKLLKEEAKIKVKNESLNTKERLDALILLLDLDL